MACLSLLGGRRCVPGLQPTGPQPPCPLPLAGWNCTTEPAQQVGAVICSATRTVVPWSVLPARVTYCQEEAASFGPENKGETCARGSSSSSSVARGASKGGVGA